MNFIIDAFIDFFNSLSDSDQIKIGKIFVRLKKARRLNNYGCIQYLMSKDCTLNDLKDEIIKYRKLFMNGEKFEDLGYYNAKVRMFDISKSNRGYDKKWRLD